jgi:A/G-specific adenine glycosylase
MRARQQYPNDADLRRARNIGHALDEWFRRAGRDFPWRHWRDGYRLAVTEILLQRTQATTVARFIIGFLEKYPDAQSLASADAQELELDLLPLGIHRRRAAALRGLGVSLTSQPEVAWEDRPGVGQYVSRAIAVGMNDERVPMVDSNFVRILRRAFGGTWMADYRYDLRLQTLATAIVQAGSGSREVNWAVLDVGALICRPQRPSCYECPIHLLCRTGRLVRLGQPNPGDAFTGTTH